MANEIYKLVEEQVKSEPMGVSQWKALGVKYKYWEYFRDEVIAEFFDQPDHGHYRIVRRQVKSEIIKIIQDMPTEFPQYESIDFDGGARSFKNDLLNKLK